MTRELEWSVDYIAGVWSVRVNGPAGTVHVTGHTRPEAMREARDTYEVLLAILKDDEDGE